MVYMSGYLNNIIEFNINSNNYLALCIQYLSTDEVLCFRISKKEKESQFAHKIYLLDGSYSGYRIEYPCLFRLNISRIKKRIMVCSDNDVKQAIVLYKLLPSIESLKKQANDMLKEMKNPSVSQKKSLRRKYNALVQLINKRTCIEFYVTEKQNGKYSNFKRIPNKDGIKHIYQGGTCSPK